MTTLVPVAIGIDFIGRHKLNYHKIIAMTTPVGT